MQIKQKVLIYATNQNGLLVFEEPDFPEVPLQVPGGTVEMGEIPECAARREFTEETGVILGAETSLLDLGQYYERTVHAKTPHILERHAYSVALPDDLPPTWDHWETQAHDKAPPILFRFTWLPLAAARMQLGLGMEKPLDAVAKSLGTNI